MPMGEMRRNDRCVHCGSRLSLLKRFLGNRFCSADHDREYEAGMATLELQRLSDALTKHDPTQGARPPAEAQGHHMQAA